MVSELVPKKPARTEKMSSIAKFDIKRFDGQINFSIWKVQMRAVLTQNGLKKALDGKSKKPPTMTDESWEDLDEKALTAIQLCLSDDVLREVIQETSTAALWNKLEALYMTKNLANKLRLKEKLYTLRMTEGSSLRAHLNEFNAILIDLENLEVKIEDEDKAVLLVVSLPPSYKHFKEIMLYSSSETLSYEDVKSNLLSKEKFDNEMPSEKKGDALTARGRSQARQDSNKKPQRSKSRGKNTGKSCKYCKKLGHEVDECYKLKNKKEREEKNKNSKTPEAAIADTDSDGDVLVATAAVADSKDEWILDSGYTYHMCH